MILTFIQSPSPTRTVSRPEWGGSQLRPVARYGRIAALVQSLVAAFAAALALILLANGMAQAQTPPRTFKLVVLGDSLSAGYNLPANAAFPAVLEQALRQKGIAIEIANAGVSGDTVQGGLDRLDWSVPDGTDGVILELGANDALRGFDPAATEKALEEIITRLRARKIPVLLAGMYAPRNLGSDYATRYDGMFKALADKYGLVFYPFFLDGIAGDRKLNQPDLLHPTAEGVRVIVERILPTVERFLETLRTQP
ncbi:acyl-CoA thioesterase-1 [Bosea sp. BK604]|nr:acyl-CoA thioesterase-1 [Bosea sp. BK604]